jgi:sugar lactone lactonase YvrE
MVLVSDVQCVLETSCSLGESPVWDARTETLYSVDINSKQIHVFVPATSQHRVLQLNEAVGTVALSSNPDQLIAALERDVVLVNAQTGDVASTLVSTPEEHGLPADGWRFNDGKVTFPAHV